MARARNIKPALFKNELLGQADPIVSLLFVGLWTLADKKGILEDRPLRIKAELFPYREKLDLNRYLTVLAELGFITRYSVDGEPLIWINKFEDHQHPHHTETPSTKLTPLESDGCSITVRQPLDNRYTPSDSLQTDSLNTDSLQTEGAVVNEQVEKILQRWNESAKRGGFHQCRGVGPILQTLRKKVKDPGWTDLFLGCLPYIEGSDFYKGKNDRGWKADIEWLLRPGNVEKFSGRPPDTPTNGKQPEHKRSADEALLAQLKEMGIA